MSRPAKAGCRRAEKWGYVARVPKVSVYLPDELYRRARERHISLSAVTQKAVERALRTSDVTDWVARERARPPRGRRQVDITGLMDEVREEFGA
jgi:post-segregation antitoxin (ccd killing protein)